MLEEDHNFVSLNALQLPCSLKQEGELLDLYVYSVIFRDKQ